MLIYAKARRQKIKWPVTRPEPNGRIGGGAGDAPDIDLERVVYDPEYRKQVVRRLNRGVGADKGAKPS